MALDFGEQFMIPTLDRELYNVVKFLIILYMQYKDVANFSFFLLYAK